MSIEAKRARVKEINDLLENNPKYSKNERNALVEERNQLQLEISNPQMAAQRKPKNAEAQQKPGGAKPAEVDPKRVEEKRK